MMEISSQPMMAESSDKMAFASSAIEEEVKGPSPSIEPVAKKVEAAPLGKPEFTVVING